MNKKHPENFLPNPNSNAVIAVTDVQFICTSVMYVRYQMSLLVCLSPNFVWPCLNGLIFYGRYLGCSILQLNELGLLPLCWFSKFCTFFEHIKKFIEKSSPKPLARMDKLISETDGENIVLQVDFSENSSIVALCLLPMHGSPRI